MRKNSILSAVTMAACLMVSFSVLAQDGDAITLDSLRARMPDEQLRAMSGLLFKDDIKAGRLSED